MTEQQQAEGPLTPGDNPPVPKAKKKLTWPEALRPSWNWVPGGAVVVGAVLAIYLAAEFLDRAGQADKPLTDLEQTFFGAYTLVVGAAISWIVTHYYAKRETEDRFRQLARPALRRVAAARESTDGLLAAIDRRRRSGVDAEPFRSLRELVEQHARVLDDAIADWKELLPAEAEEARLLAENSTRTEQLIAALGDRLEELEASKKGADKTVDASKFEALKAEVKKLQSDLRDQKFAYYASSTPSSILNTHVIRTTIDDVGSQQPTFIVKPESP